MSTTYRSTKELISELSSTEEPPTDLFDDVEHLLFKYQIFVQQGIREKIGDHNGVSWYLVPDDERALISYQDGTSGEWEHGCYADEVPMWLLIGLFRRIQHRKPLGDQEADETIAAVDSLDAEYVSNQEERDLDAQLGRLNTRRRGSE